MRRGRKAFPGPPLEERDRIMKAKILLVEDEEAIADTILYALSTEGMEARWCRTGAEGWEALHQGSFSLIVLDVGLPDLDGFELCRRIRKGSAVPILFLTARSEVIDRVVGLEIGGDDYLPKPFSPRELTARIKAILRRSEKEPGEGKGPEPEPRGETAAARPASGPPGPALMPASDRVSTPIADPSVEKKVGDFSWDAERCRIAFRGRPLDLTRYEYRLLGVLLERPGRVYSREQLMAKAWDEPEASLERTVDAHIKSLRAKLKALDPSEDPIRTHRGLGYSLREEEEGPAA